jgi:hypothetical protein
VTPLVQIRHHLPEFFTWCADHAGILEIHTLARTIDRLAQPIITAIELAVSNAGRAYGSLCSCPDRCLMPML